MELSKRLQKVADLVTEGASVADIGTDHGYIPIYLIKNHKAVKALALDVNKGPLERAEEHIAEEGLSAVIDTRLSDGMEALAPYEVQEIITAGMGGGLVIKILTDYPKVTASLHYGILQPQSEIHKVRRFLNDQGYRIVAEDFVEEDGKYYPMMKVDFRSDSSETYTDCQYFYGKRLLEEKHPILLKYLYREKKIKEDILCKLDQKMQENPQERIADRILDIQEELKIIEEALDAYH